MTSKEESLSELSQQEKIAQLERDLAGARRTRTLAQQEANRQLLRARAAEEENRQLRMTVEKVDANLDKLKARIDQEIQEIQQLKEESEKHHLDTELLEWLFSDVSHKNALMMEFGSDAQWKYYYSGIWFYDFREALIAAKAKIGGRPKRSSTENRPGVLLVDKTSVNWLQYALGCTYTSDPKMKKALESWRTDLNVLSPGNILDLRDAVVMPGADKANDTRAA